VTERNEAVIPQMTDLAVELGAAGHHIFFLGARGRGVDVEAESLKAREYERLLNRILDKQREVEIELKPTCAPQFHAHREAQGHPDALHQRCLAGTSYCVIIPTATCIPARTCR